MDNCVNLPVIMSLLPENLITEIGSLGSDLKMKKWRLGDLVLEVYAHFAVHQMPHNLMEAAWVVHVLMNGEKAQNTLRHYAMISQFYPAGVRAYLHCEDLPYSHFEYAATLEGDHLTGKPNWQFILEISYARMLVNGGKPVSVDNLRLLMATPKQSLPAANFSANPVSTPDIYKTPVVGRLGGLQGQVSQAELAFNRLVELVEEIKGLLPAIQGDKPQLASFLGGLVLSTLQYLDAKKNGLLVDDTVFDSTIDSPIKL